VTQSPAAFISYAREPDDPAHEESVLRLWTFLRSCGVDARLDLGEADQRRDWALWLATQIREADYILVIASPAYRRGAEGRGDAHEERGVQYQARLIRDALYADQHAVNRFVPVLLPGRSEDGVPDFFGPFTSSVYPVTDFTLAGADKLLRLLTNQPEILQPPLGPVPALAPRSVPSSAPIAPVTPKVQPATDVRNVIAGEVSGVSIQVGNAGSVSISPPGVPVGEGADPRTRRAFEDACRRACLGKPAGQAFPAGPGYVQHLTDGTVLCAVAGKQAVAVAGPVWDDLATLPGFPDGPGFPIGSVDPDAHVVDLDGGTWGAGLLLRGPGPRWQPRPRIGPEARQAFRLPVAGPANLTVRAIATLPWQLDDDLEITRRTRERIEAMLLQAEVTAQIPALSRRRGVPLSWLRWTLASGPDVRQTGRDARYDQTGDENARASARVMLPDSLTSAITVAVEFRIDLQLTANEIVDLWTAAWDAATVVVPGALVPDPERAALLAPPVVELHVKTDGNLLDLSVFGKPAGRPGSEGAVTVVAPVGLGRDERRAWAAKALTRLARDWGFVDADESDLR